MANSKKFKDAYSRLSPSKLSSQKMLVMYTLLYMKKRKEDGDQDVYAQEVVEDLEINCGTAVWQPSCGTLYGIFSNLEELGYINKVDKIGVGRKIYYNITKLGEEYLNKEYEPFVLKISESVSFFSNMMKTFDN